MKLSVRRPDLERLQLSPANADVPAPYIEIIIDLLEAFVRTRGVDTYERLAQASFPPQLPFHLPLEQTRAYLRALGSSLPAVYETLALPFEGSDLEPGDAVREKIGMSPAELALVTSEAATPDSLLPLFGNASVADLADVPTFLQRTGLTRNEFIENYLKPRKPVVFTDLSKDWPAAKKWTFEYLAENFGDLDVPVVDPSYHIPGENYMKSHITMKFGDYLRAIQRGPSELRVFLWNIMEHAPALTQLASMRPGKASGSDRSGAHSNWHRVSGRTFR